MALNAEPHEKYYFLEGTVVIRIEQTLYRLHREILTRRSVVFNDMFTMPQGTQQVQGKHDSDPIVLQYISIREFNALLDFLYLPWSPPPYNVDDLARIYRLSRMWLIEDAKQFARHHLDIATLHPARKIELARCFGFETWLAPAFGALAAMSLRELSTDHVYQIGIETYVILARAKEAIERERRLAAAVPPKVPFDFDCIEHDQCKRIWVSIWIKKVAVALLHPDFPKPFEEIAGFLRTLEFSGMDPHCRQRAIEELETDGFVRRDHEVIEQAVAALSPLYQSDEPAAIDAVAVVVRAS